MPQIGPAEILVILLVGLLVFGPHRLPEIGRQVGKGMRELRKFQDTVKGELDQVLNADEPDRARALCRAGLPPGAASCPRQVGRVRRVTTGGLRRAPRGARAAGARAPSRFRAPGTPPRA